MSKDRWLIVTAGVVLILAMTLFVFSVVTDRRREVAVGKLKAKRAEVFAQRTSEPPAADKKIPGQTAPKADKMAEPGEDTASAFRQVSDQRKAFLDNSAWKEAEVIVEKEKPKEWTEADRKKVAEYLGATGGLIQEVHRLAESGGPAYELDYSKGYAMELPHLATLRYCVRLLAADAALQAFGGNYGEAVEDLLTGMKLADSLTHEPILISQLVRLALDRIVYSTVEQAIRGEDLTPDLSRNLMQCASRASGGEAFANSFSGDGLFGLGAFDGIRAGDPELGGFKQETQSTMESILIRAYGSTFARPLLNMDEASYAGLVGRMGDVARLPFYEAQPLLDEIKRDIDDLPRTRWLSRQLLPTLPRTVEAQALHEAQLGLMRVGLAVEQYHAQNGTYPPTLDEVAPVLGGAVPLDPFTGKPLAYQPSGGSFMLYSAMGSGIDLRARYTFRQIADKDGNLVWRGSR